jgi:hypothetical protein
VGNLQALVYATDSGRAGVGWQDVLSYTATPLPYPSAGPSGSVTPITGAGMSPTFTIASQDLNGWKYIFTDHALAGATSGSMANSCLFVPLNWAGGAVYLLDNTGTIWLGPAYANSPSTLSNGQCSINSGGLTVSAYGNNLTFQLSVNFTTAFSGLQNTYLRSRRQRYGDGAAGNLDRGAEP